MAPGAQIPNVTAEESWQVAESIVYGRRAACHFFLSFPSTHLSRLSSRHCPSRLRYVVVLVLLCVALRHTIVKGRLEMLPRPKYATFFLFSSRVRRFSRPLAPYLGTSPGT